MKYHKAYNNLKEELYRKEVFFENLRSICAHNENFKKNLETYEKGVNFFADMDFNEFRSTHLGFNFKMMKLANFNSIPFETFSRRSEIPSNVNWTKTGAVSRVKRQGEFEEFSTISVLTILIQVHVAPVMLSLQLVVLKHSYSESTVY